jgi:amidophosphoribosyltransferase
VIRADGRLGHELSPEEHLPQDACGVFGIFAPDEDVARLTYFGLYALQHRGTESAGIAVSDGESIMVYKDMGLVAQVFNDSNLEGLKGYIAVGHTRYSTTGSSNWENAQPTFHSSEHRQIALGHNGNLMGVDKLQDVLIDEKRIIDGKKLRGTSDTEVVAALIASNPLPTTNEALLAELPRLKGAFSFVLTDAKSLIGIRDPNGIRPLVIGELDKGYVITSETAALDIVGARFIREVEPGEIVTINETGISSARFAKATPTHCLFEYVYLARPDTNLSGRSVHATRVEVGRRLAHEHPAPGELVIPVPDSGTPAAVGYAQASGIPFAQGLIKNAYVGRTFIQPTQTIRQLGIKLKLNPLREVIEGRRLVVVDDSIVRGNTQKAIIKMLKDAGALEVHVRISAPPVLWPCFYGIDFAQRTELIGHERTIDEIREFIGADSLGYVSLDSLIQATKQAANTLCKACFDGKYPIEVAEDVKLGKHHRELPVLND